MINDVMPHGQEGALASAKWEAGGPAWGPGPLLAMKHEP